VIFVVVLPPFGWVPQTNVAAAPGAFVKEKLTLRVPREAATV
jgi:hypothetical protein